VRRRRQQQGSVRRGAGGLAAVISRNPRESVGVLTGTFAVFAIFINALFLQHGPHPAPIFATRPAPAPQRQAVLPPPRAAALAPAPEAPVHSRTQIITDIQRELARRGFYDGAADGIWGARTDAAVRDFAQAAGLKIDPDATDSLLRAIASSTVKAQSSRAGATEPVRNDPIAQLIAPSKRVVAIQRALAEFGYGQIKATGVEDPETQVAIEKFERDRRLPVTGRISDRFVRELAAMTGRPLE
jgi:peptidoglycan hydrolase-like protein with peptidoglycan-binding domain